MTKKQKADLSAEAVAVLKSWEVVHGTVIWARVNQVSSSGMSRRISLYIVNDTKDIVDITYWTAKALGWQYTKYEDMRVGGCGMDMLFHTIDCLSHEMGYGAIAQSSSDTKGLIYRHM